MTDREQLAKMMEVNEMARIRFAGFPVTVAKCDAISIGIRAAIAKIDAAAQAAL